MSSEVTTQPGVRGSSIALHNLQAQLQLRVRELEQADLPHSQCL